MQANLRCLYDFYNCFLTLAFKSLVKSKFEIRLLCSKGAEGHFLSFT